MELQSMQININDIWQGSIDINNPVIRYSDNPILTPDSINEIWKKPEHQVITVHNAGIATYNTETVMLFRSHLRCGMSILGIAFSSNGINQWQVCEQPALLPATERDVFAPGVDKLSQIEMEAGGIEDPRITKIGNEYAITYSAYHSKIKNRVRVCLATTSDFCTFTRHGPVLNRDMRNVVLFPEPSNDGYAALFRPNDITSGDIGGIYTQIQIGYTDDWKSGRWKIIDEPIMKTGGGPSAFSDKIGPGAPPFKCREGWLSLFHGVRTTMAGNPYVLGVALHDRSDYEKMIMSSTPILFPSKEDCKLPEKSYIHVPQVVFTCGAKRLNDGTVIIYYGGNDTVMNCAFTHEDILIDLCRKLGQHPTTGDLLYAI